MTFQVGKSNEEEARLLPLSLAVDRVEALGSEANIVGGWKLVVEGWAEEGVSVGLPVVMVKGLLVINYYSRDKLTTW